MMIFRSAAAIGLGIEMVAHLSEAETWMHLGYQPLPLMGVVFGIAFLLMEGHESVIAFLDRFRRVNEDRDAAEPDDGDAPSK